MLSASLISSLIIGMSLANGPTGAIKGHIEIGPLSPVQRVGEKQHVPPAMYKGLMVQMSKLKTYSSKALIATVDKSGHFEFKKVVPGSYRLQIIFPPTNSMKADPITVQVQGGKPTTAKLRVDTGIR